MRVPGTLQYVKNGFVMLPGCRMNEAFLLFALHLLPDNEIIEV
ncbi:hypothetical protein J2X61_006030 [Bacillus sp. 3255]|nr:hypothetical protein [Bacillus sp. 3255]